MATSLQTLFGEWPEESLQIADGNHSIKVKLLHLEEIVSSSIVYRLSGYQPMGPARKSLFMAEKEQWSYSSQEQDPSAYVEGRTALLVPAFMPKPEIEAFLADQGFVPQTFDKNDPRYMKKRDALKIYATEDDLRANCQQLGGVAHVLYGALTQSMTHHQLKVRTIYRVIAVPL
ncbi:MAG: hypothetical protein EZS28_003400 [Streblomastix strix]|uniref:Uncharacterized protein n=1 Tax=Streblomastix strix TaxID=222440 RepID=A0A5J4X3L6_9EUKA|nr:MAG: hypothetical protein EZS28_003400 [Streblomastix strix]